MHLNVPISCEHEYKRVDIILTGLCIDSIKIFVCKFCIDKTLHFSEDLLYVVFNIITYPGGKW
jgi:hypothetical protein